MIIAILMAGGKGERIKANIEKPLLKFKSKTLIEHVLDNLNNSNLIDEIVIAISPNTPKTKEFLIEKNVNRIEGFNKAKNSIEKNVNRIEGFNKAKNPIEIEKSYIDTSGNGYVEDISLLLSKFENRSKNDVLIIINSDLPFISSKIIDYVLEKYMENDKPALSVMVPISIFKKYGIEPSIIFEDLVPSGLNILINRNEIQSEEKLIIPLVELALNINTCDDLELANDIFK